MPLNEVTAYLSMHRIKCSKSNLSRIENENGFPRADILAGLALIYGVTVDSIVFIERKKKI